MSAATSDSTAPSSSSPAAAPASARRSPARSPTPAPRWPSPAAAAERIGRLDVVVSNAAGYETGPLTDLADDARERLRATDVDACHLAEAALPPLAQSRGYLVAVPPALDRGARGVRLDAVAPAVLPLASGGARYVTGAVLPADGGTSASTGQPHP